MEIAKSEFNYSLSARKTFQAVLPIFGLLIVVLAFHHFSGDSFLTSRNLSNLSRQVCVNLTLAVGMTLVILTAGIDLSVGSVLALCGMVSAISQVSMGLGEWGATGAVLSFVMAVSVGGLCGGFTGFAVSRLNITPFIVTLGMMVICRGLTLIISNAQAVAPIGESLGALSYDYLAPMPSAILFGVIVLGWSYFCFMQSKRNRFEATKNFIYGILFCAVGALVFCGYRGIPYMVFVAAFVAIGGIFLLKYTRYGRFVFAIGGNREAAELSGIPLKKTLITTYLIMGCLAGLAGVMDSTRVNGAVPSAGELAELDAIAAVVIGGTSLMGGLGSITGTLFGVLIMGILNNGLSLVGVSEHYQKVFKGLVIILAVYLDMRSKRK